ncbi:hypothetical protein F5050DRAFT_854011 [Lentinula boryana]|uniref:Retrotransposon gag domain-containing protein n=1 Tax=Lentinula boryana TaxID=40481 RepID=A0ABQ8QMX7_9AGAR|nr:hypothetical protein F5050DRAFT_854011 [Lentinula boryana]
MATRTTRDPTGTVRYQLPDRRRSRGSTAGSPQGSGSPSSRIPGGFQEQPGSQDELLGDGESMVGYEEMKREMTPRLANTSRAKEKRRVEVPNVGTSSNRLVSEPLTDDAPRPNESRQESERQTEVRPEDSASQLGSQGNGTERPPGHNDTQSQVSSTGSKARAQEYQRELRKRIALDILYRDDTMNNGVSTIPEQNIDYEDDFGFDPRQPKVRINWKKIPDEEIDAYRDEYPEIIKKPTNRGSVNRESTSQRRYLEPPTGRKGGHAPRPRQNMTWGYTPPHNGRPQAYASPERNPRRDDSPPPPEPRYFRSGNGDRDELYDRGLGTRDPGGGGPPSEPPSQGGDDDSSPTESEDDRRPDGRRKKKARQPSREPTPNRYQSEDPNATIVETYNYDPKPRSEEEVLRASFYRYEQQIMFYLYGPPLNQTSSAQKAILQNIPKPSKWNGESDYTRFDDWMLGMIQWMNIADQCGPPMRFSQTRGGHILTSVDLIRTNTLGSYLEGNALRWFRDEVQKVPDGFSTSHNPDPLSYRWTFMQVVNGLYQRFIHEASISQVADKFNEVTYNRRDGAKVMFSELKRWAVCMPIPPDLYTFKRRILLLVPPAMCKDMTRIEKVSAEKSSVNQIMQAAISCERGDRTGRYYANARAVNEQSQQSMKAAHKESTLPYSESKGKDAEKGHPRKERSRSPRRLQIIDKRRYSIPDHDQIRRDNSSKEKGSTKSEGAPSGKPTGKRGACFDCGAQDHYRGSPLCKQQRTVAKADTQQRPRLYRIAEEVQEGGERMFRLKETSEDEVAKSDLEDLSDEEIWVRYENESGSEVNHTGNMSEGEPDPWGGSQFESDAADEDYIPAPSSEDQSHERMGHMRDWDTFAVHWRDQLEERFNALDTDNDCNQEVATACENMQETLPVKQEDSEPQTFEAYRLDFKEYLRSMTRTEDGGFQATTGPKKTRIERTGNRPVRLAKDNRCLCAFMEINGVLAFVLFDSGSTADAVSPDFARISHIKPFQLENPVTLQLGTKGSRSRITFGCTSRYRILGGTNGDVTGKDYFDIANVDRYDAVLGTVFMRKHGIALDFERNVIRLSGKEIPTLTEGDENRELARRYAKNVSSNIHLKEGEELPVKSRPHKQGTLNNK